MLKSLRRLAFGQTSDASFWRHRKGLGSRNLFSKIWHRIRYERILSKNGAWISVLAKIPEPFRTPHGLSGIFISAGAEIGTGCVIFQQVTIGSNTLRDTKSPGAPRIGDNVFIGVGAKIIGGVTIGSGVRIGANCVVTCDVPDNATVVMQSARIIEHTGERENLFHSYKKEDLI